MNTEQKLENKEIKKVIHSAVQGVKDKVPAQVLPMIEEALLRIELEGMSPLEAMEIPQEFIEEIYEKGYFFYQSGKYQDALTLFNFVTYLSGGSDPRFIFAIAATHHQLKNYVEAAGYYMLYEAIHPKDPIPYYHLYDCFKKIGNPELARNALKAAGKLAEKDPRYSELKHKIDLEIQQNESLEK